MNALKTIPAVIAALLLGAHFYRAGMPLLIPVALAIIPLAVVPRAWARIAARVLLAAGAVEWILTAARIARFRAARGLPSTRLWIILGAVAVFTLLAAWLVPRVAARRDDGPA